MEKRDSTPSKKEKASLPPKRGQIKAKIFGDIVKTVVTVVSKAGGGLGIKRGEGSGGESSTSTSPPQSSYNSEGNSNS
ncbi:hypothetical protein HHK36_018270 [Tetracentron sinense]|uniref:Uncharacterized protein n=1 Tax=Tetracentron sinense TaxID=13715 RepID=A0A835DB40_TETSI|nr:hypothetical protein HHK36_018270 [Tetracentron sinense]